MTSAPAVPAEPVSAKRWPPRAQASGVARVLAAPLGGALLYEACAPRTLWWLAPLAFALLWIALRDRSLRAGWALGLLFGLAYFCPLLPWIGIYVGPVPWLALAGLEAVILAVGAAAITRVCRLPWAPVWAAALWVATESLASRFPFGGFPWGQVAFSQADGPFVRLAALGGSPLVSFAVVLTGFGLAACVGVPRTRELLVPAVVCLVVPVLVAAAAVDAVTGAGQNPAGARQATIAAVQGNVPRLGLDFNAQRRAVLDYHIRRTEQLADDVAAQRVPRPDFVLWPENSSDIDPLLNPDANAEISGVVDRLGVPLLVGAVLVEPDGEHTTNSALVWEPRVGPTQRADKRRVQPFGEYLPWRPFFRLFSAYADRAGHFVPGTGPGVVTLHGVPVGVAICWEIAFDDEVNDSVRHGAQLLAVPSNNATFGRSDMTFQQLAMSRLRAVEHHRAVVVVATTGESAIIDPDGTVVARTPLFEPAALVRQVPLLTATTLATRLGSTPAWGLTLLGLAALAYAEWSSRRQRGTPKRGENGAQHDG
ncbi:MAG TPA: apolipoprotein N-acyltransferase [Pseudonocardia sp.]|nr:apolipoprotein N-acyltransferase [Pseudonocardia sp.]